MKNRISVFLSLLSIILSAPAVVESVATPTATPNLVFARGGLRSTSGFCLSGKRVGNVKNCKENGGTK